MLFRELAFQIADQFAVLGAPLNVRIAAIVGGMNMMTQAIEPERRPHVVVATPGQAEWLTIYVAQAVIDA